MPWLRSTYDRRSICETSYEERKAFLRYDSLANDIPKRNPSTSFVTVVSRSYDNLMINRKICCKSGRWVRSRDGRTPGMRVRRRAIVRVSSSRLQRSSPQTDLTRLRHQHLQ